MTSARIPDEEACYHTRNLCVFSHTVKKEHWDWHIKDVTVVLGMRQSINSSYILFPHPFHTAEDTPGDKSLETLCMSLGKLATIDLETLQKWLSRIIQDSDPGAKGQENRLLLQNLTSYIVKENRWVEMLALSIFITRDIIIYCYPLLNKSIYTMLIYGASLHLLHTGYKERHTRNVKSEFWFHFKLFHILAVDTCEYSI